jgi:hypothetical protein
MGFTNQELLEICDFKKNWKAAKTSSNFPPEITINIYQGYSK